jgi:hypothetical protein
MAFEAEFSSYSIDPKTGALKFLNKVDSGGGGHAIWW